MNYSMSFAGGCDVTFEDSHEPQERAGGDHIEPAAVGKTARIDNGVHVSLRARLKPPHPPPPPPTVISSEPVSDGQEISNAYRLVDLEVLPHSERQESRLWDGTQGDPQLFRPILREALG